MRQRGGRGQIGERSGKQTQGVCVALGQGACQEPALPHESKQQGPTLQEHRHCLLALPDQQNQKLETRGLRPEERD
jgi:hypothetical protein